MPLTTGTVLFAQQDMHDKEKVALHEAGHAVMLESQEKESVIFVIVENRKSLLNIYLGVARFLSSVNDKTKLVGCFGGFVQDMEDSKKLERQNFMNQELGLPLAGVFTDNKSQLDQMWQHFAYDEDLELVVDASNKIARRSLPYSASQDQIDRKTHEVMVKGLQETKKLVRENQASIQAVAQALCKSKKLSGDEIRAIIAQTRSGRE